METVHSLRRNHLGPGRLTEVKLTVRGGAGARHRRPQDAKGRERTRSVRFSGALAVTPGHSRTGAEQAR